MATKKKSEIGDTVDPVSPIIDLEAEEVRTEDTPSATHHAESPTSDPPPPPPRDKKPVVSSRMLGGAALVALAAIGGAWLYKSYGARFWPTDEMANMAQRVEALEAENQTLDDQLKGLGAIVDGLKSNTQDLGTAIKTVQSANEAVTQSVSNAEATAKQATNKLGAAEGRLASVEKAVEGLRSTLAGGSVTVSGQSATIDPGAVEELRARIAAVEQEIAALKSTGGRGDSQTATVLSQALADLKAKIAAGAPYAEDLQRIGSLVPAAPGLDVLEGSAQEGVATPAMLAEQAQQIAEQQLPPAVAPPVESSEESYWDSIVRTLQNVITIRRIGDTDWRDIALKASEAASQGDVRRAVEIIGGGNDVPAALRIWREKALTRLKADAAVEELSQAVLRQIAAIGGTP